MCWIICSGGITNPWPDVRLMGVLNRIALVYFFAGLLFCYCSRASLVAVSLGLLVGYWALLAGVPIRDIQLTRPGLVARAEQTGDTQKAALLRQPGNSSAVKNSPVWAAAEAMFTPRRIASPANTNLA